MVKRERWRRKESLRSARLQGANGEGEQSCGHHGSQVVQGKDWPKRAPKNEKFGPPPVDSSFGGPLAND